MMYVHSYLIYTADYMMVMFWVFLQDGWNALHCAAFGGHVDVVDSLCQRYPSMITQTDKVSKHNSKCICDQI